MPVNFPILSTADMAGTITFLFSQQSMTIFHSVFIFYFVRATQMTRCIFFLPILSSVSFSEDEIEQAQWTPHHETTDKIRSGPVCLETRTGSVAIPCRMAASSSTFFSSSFSFLRAERARPA